MDWVFFFSLIPFQSVDLDLSGERKGGGGGGGPFCLVIFAVDNKSSDQWNMTCKNLLQSDFNSSDLNMYFYFFADQPEFTKHPESQAVKERSKSVTFSCDTDSNPALTFLWTKDGIPLNVTTNPRYSLSDDKKQLRITDVNETDRGEYKCVVQRGANTVNSTDAAMLTVECKDNIFSPIQLY